MVMCAGTMDPLLAVTLKRGHKWHHSFSIHMLVTGTEKYF